MIMKDKLMTPLQTMVLESEIKDLGKFIMEMYDIYHNSFVINEALDDFTRDTDDIGYQFDEAKRRYQAALRGLALSNKLRDPAQRQENKRRVMGNMNRLRGIVRRVEKEIDALISRQLSHDSGYRDRFDRARMASRFDRPMPQDIG